MAEYLRGRIWWITYAGPDGDTVFESTRQSDRRVAQALYRQRKREMVSGDWSRGGRNGATKLSVADYAERWLVRIHERKLRTARDYETRCRRHVLPVLGKMALADLRPRHVEGFVEHLKGAMRERTIAPRTVHHIYDTLRLMCRYAVLDEVIQATPCVLAPGVLPKKRDKDPTWRSSAVFTRDEVERIISDGAVPEDRRALYALLFLTGMRFGEAAGRRWRDYDRDALPLGRLVVATQYEGRALKTELPREIPMHPTLAATLAEWKLRGLPVLLGRDVRPEDWIVPSRRGVVRSVRHAHRKFQEDLERLGLRRRRLHDTRRTFISLARVDGARSDMLRHVTHGAGGDIVDQYTTLPWPTLCEAVHALRVARRWTSPVAVLSRARDLTIKLTGTE